MSNATLANMRVWRNGIELTGLMSVEVPSVDRDIVEDSRHVSGVTKLLGYTRYSPLVLVSIDPVALIALSIAIALNALDAYEVQTPDAYITFTGQVADFRYMVATVDGLYGATVAVQPISDVTWNGVALGTLPVVESVLLLEDGTSLLLETGDSIVV